jgi:hypothetical protein
MRSQRGAHGDITPHRSGTSDFPYRLFLIVSHQPIYIEHTEYNYTPLSLPSDAVHTGILRYGEEGKNKKKKKNKTKKQSKKE